MKQNVFFVIFEELSLKQIKYFFLEGESPTLKSGSKRKIKNKNINQKYQHKDKTNV